jgi:hypothetical protein
MPGKHDFDESELRPDDEPDEAFDLEDRRDQAREIRDEPDGESRVARRPTPLPSREEDDEELAEADILEELDLDDEDTLPGRHA